MLFHILRIGLKEDVHGRPELLWVHLCPVTSGIPGSLSPGHKLSATPPEFCHGLELELRPWDQWPVLPISERDYVRRAIKGSPGAEWAEQLTQGKPEAQRSPSENWLQLQQCSFVTLPCRESFYWWPEEPYGEVFNQIWKPKNWERVANVSHIGRLRQLSSWSGKIYI